MSEMPVPDFSDFDNEDEHEAEGQESETHSFPHINPSDLVEMMNDENVELILIDCRFDYEYGMGHINKARSVNWPNEIDHYFTCIKDRDACFDSVVVVFYCEYSMNRGPTMASIFRRIDRSLNYKRYPFIFFQNVAILKGGFKNFYKQFPKLCDGYHLPMWDRPALVNYNMKKREKLIKNLINEENDENEGNNQENGKIHFSLSQPIFLKI